MNRPVEALPETPADTAPRARRVAAVVMALEGVAILVVASVVVSGGGRSGVSWGFATGLAAFMSLFAAAILLAAVSLWRRGRFGVGYGITWQLFQALVSASMLRSALYVPGALGLVSAIVVFVLLLGIARSTPTPLEQEDVPPQRRR